MSSVGTPDPPPEEPNSAWLTDQELADVRRRIPLLYVEAVPVRVDGMGVVTSVGVLLRANAQGDITRTLVSGRVMFGETIRDALFRHLEKDLGPMAFPLLPASPVPFQVAEYFPIPGLSAYVDERQHAVHRPDGEPHGAIDDACRAARHLALEERRERVEVAARAHRDERGRADRCLQLLRCAERTDAPWCISASRSQFCSASSM